MPFGLSLLRTTDIPLEMNMTQRNEGPAPQSYTLCLAAASFSSDVFWWRVRENGSSGSELNLCNFFFLLFHSLLRSREVLKKQIRVLPLTFSTVLGNQTKYNNLYFSKGSGIEKWTNKYALTSVCLMVQICVSFYNDRPTLGFGATFLSMGLVWEPVWWNSSKAGGLLVKMWLSIQGLLFLTLKWSCCRVLRREFSH